jgi:hypothetical protein
MEKREHADLKLKIRQQWKEKRNLLVCDEATHVFNAGVHQSFQSLEGTAKKTV